MEFTDTHCHLNHEDFDADQPQTYERAQAAGVTRMLCIGYDLASSRRAAALTEWEGVYAAVGIHPEAAGQWNDETAAALTEIYRAGVGIVAYGEIGLDYHWDTVPHEQQRTVFAEQIGLARTLSATLPLIIHNRDAGEDVLSILKAEATPAPVVIHCFTGDTNAARDFLDAGFYLGIGGVATFKKSEAIREAVAYAPLNQLLLETDCPYLAPQFKRGRRNEPSYLPAVAETVAQAKNLTVEEIAAATTATARRLFGV